MSKLSQLQGKGKSFNIGGIDLFISPLRVDDIGMLNIDKDASAKKQMEQTRLIINKVLKDSVPDATEEEIGAIGANYLEDIMNAIMDVNGFGGKKGVDLIKDKLKQ